MGKRLIPYLPALFVWVIVSIVNTLKFLPDIINGVLPGNDDYMRLVQVRDYLNGQGFTDLTQDRLYPADPLLSHWARLSDVIIGGIIKLFTPLFGSGTAEILALFIVPSGLLLITLLLLVAIAKRLSNSEWMPLAVAMTAGLYVPMLTQFSPGRIDHHGLQLALAAGAILALIKSEHKRRWMVISGALCAVSLWTGTESLPFVAGMFVSAGLIYVLGAPNAANRLRGFGAGYAVTLLGLYAATFPIKGWFVAACDALSPVYLVMTCGAALALIICTLLPAKHPMKRLVALGALGATSVILTLVIFPHCLKGPYAELDPRLAQIWLANVQEAKPLFSYIIDSPYSAIALCIVPFFAGIAVFRIARREGLWATFASSLTIRSLVVICIFSLLGSLVQLRLIIFAGLAAAPLAGLLMVAALDWSEKYTGDVKRAFIRAGLILILSPIAFSMLSLIEQSSQDDNATVSRMTSNHLDGEEKDKPEQVDLLAPSCKSMRFLRALNRLEPGLAITQIDMGARILASTQNLSVTSAPYHRNEAGNIVALDVFMGTPEDALNVAKRIDADYLIACRDYAETDVITHLAPDGLLAQLKSNTVPDWLSPITLERDKDNLLMIYEINKE